MSRGWEKISGFPGEGRHRGRSKLLNVFHFGFETWEELGPAALLMNSAEIVQFRSLDRGTYRPYARALRKIEQEESFHYHHALDLTHQTMTYGIHDQRLLVQNAFDTWLPRVLAYFGPPDPDAHTKPVYRFGTKVDLNEDLRQSRLAKIIPTFEDLGVYVDPASAHYAEDAQTWTHAPIDWVEVRRLLNEGGPRAQDWRPGGADRRRSRRR